MKANTYNAPCGLGFSQSDAVKHLKTFLRLKEANQSPEHPNGKNASAEKNNPVSNTLKHKEH